MSTIFINSFWVLFIFICSTVFVFLLYLLFTLITGYNILRLPFKKYINKNVLIEQILSNENECIIPSIQSDNTIGEISSINNEILISIIKDPFVPDKVRQSGAAMLLRTNDQNNISKKDLKKILKQNISINLKERIDDIIAILA
jgi:hypothetical protein